MPGSEELLREALKRFAFPRATSRRPSQHGPERNRPECDTMAIEVRAGDWIRACVALGTMDRDMLMALPEHARPSLAFIDEVCPR